MASQTSGRTMDRPDPVLVDERLFAVFALLNALGFDDEFRDEGMHPVRIAVREELGQPSRLLPVEIRRYHAEHAEANWFAYTQYALMLSPPPFSLRPGYEQTWAASVLPGFDAVLSSFYSSARLAAMWQEHCPRYRDEADLMRPKVLQSLGGMWDYLRTPESARHYNVRVVPNLLNAYHRATVFEDPLSGAVQVICGPYSEQSQVDLTVVHEVLHTVLRPVMAQGISQIEGRAELMDLVGHLPAVLRHGSDFGAITEESLIRALTKRIGRVAYGPAGAEQHASQEYEEGFLLMWHFLERLQSDYEVGEAPLLSQIPRLMASVDVAKEKARWAASHG